MRRILLFLLGITFILPGCEHRNDPDRTAADFVDAYYVEYDFPRALMLADGAARTRLEDEKRLVDDARSKVPISSSRSRTYYDTPERRSVEPDLVHYTFALQIRMGSSDVRRVAVIMVGRRAGEWKVIGFREVGERYGEPAAASDRATGAAPATGVDQAIGVRSSTGARE